jgi:hypothetical protein
MFSRMITLSLLGVVSFIGSAHAHISLDQGGTQKSRYGDDFLKDGTCGKTGGTRSTNVYMYEPGQTITVSFVEFVGHPSYFRFAFDNDGDDDFKDPASMTPIDPMRGCPASTLSGDAAARDQCMKDDFYNSMAVLPMMDDLSPHPDSPDGKMYTFQVKLPDVECDNCTLQVIQVMEDPIHGPYNLTVSGFGDLEDVYHQCIDLILKKSGGAGSAGASSAGNGAAAVSGGGGTSAAVGGAGGTAIAGTGAVGGTVGSAGAVAAAGTGATAGKSAGTPTVPKAGSGGATTATVTTPTAGSPGTTTTGTTAATKPPAAAAKSGGCSVLPASASDASLAPPFAFLAAALLLIQRRRAQRQRI